MSATMIHESLTPRQAAAVYTSGYLAILIIGILATLALVVAALWLVFQFCFLALASIIETLQAIGSLYAASDPLIRFLLLAALATGSYHLARRLFRKRGHA